MTLSAKGAALCVADVFWHRMGTYDPSGYR